MVIGEAQAVESREPASPWVGVQDLVEKELDDHTLASRESKADQSLTHNPSLLLCSRLASHRFRLHETRSRCNPRDIVPHQIHSIASWSSIDLSLREL